MHTLEPIRARPETLSERVYDAVRQAVISQRLAPGERVTEAGLAEQLSVSKTPVREALLRLAHIGLIDMGNARGACVVEPSAESIREAYELRSTLETGAARLTAERASDGNLEAIAELASASLEAAQAGDRTRFRELDREFHLAIAAAAGNARLHGSIRDVIDLVGALRSRDAPRADASVQCASQHEAIAAALRDRDPGTAGDRAREHIDTVKDLVLSTFAGTGDGQAVRQ